MPRRQPGVRDQVLGRREPLDRPDVRQDRHGRHHADPSNLVDVLCLWPLVVGRLHGSLHLLPPIHQLLQFLKLQVQDHPIACRKVQALQTLEPFERPETVTIPPRLMMQEVRDPVLDRRLPLHQILATVHQPPKFTPAGDRLI